MMQPGFVMPQQQGPQGPQGGGGGGVVMPQGAQGFMMPQGGNLQPGVQYMQMILPMEQAKMMAQNGVVPLGRMSPSGPQMQMMQQQGCKGGKGGKGGQGFGMQGPGMANWGNQGKGFQYPVFNNGGKGGKDADDGKLDDWIAKRMGKAGSSSSTSAPDGSSQQMKPDQQMRPSPQQHRPQQQMQPAPFGSQQMQPWQLPSVNVQQQLQQQHELQQQQQMMWQQQQQQQWQWQPQQNNIGVQNGSMGGGFGGGDSPRTAQWKQMLASSNVPVGEADVDDWVSKRSEAPRPAFRPPRVQQQVEEPEDESPQAATIPWDVVAPLFENTKPWADVTDTDEGNIVKLMQLEEERKLQEEQMIKGEPSNAQPEVEVEPDVSLSAPTVSTEVVETVTTPTEVVSESTVRSPTAQQEPAPDNTPPPTVAPEPARSYAAAAKKTPKAAVTKAPTAATLLAEVESTRSSPPVEIATTKPVDLLQKPTQDAPGSTAVVAEEPPAPQQPSKSDSEKRKKALDKKLRQIADLEKKAAEGTALNAEETKKVATKAALEEELAQLS